MQGDGGGIRDHLAAIHEHRHLPLAGETEQLQLAQAGVTSTMLASRPLWARSSRTFSQKAECLN